MRPCPGGIYWLFSFECWQGPTCHIHLRPYHGPLIFTCYWIGQTLLNFSFCSEIDLPPFIVNTCWIFRYFFLLLYFKYSIFFFSLLLPHKHLYHATFYYWWLVVRSWLRTHGDTVSPTFVLYVVYVISFSLFLSIPSFFPSRFLVFLRPLWFLPSFWDSFTVLWFKNEF